ncbi:MAG: alanine--tRNA ligase [Bacteroidetes bacterium]|nr:alanine--tRNA ligase [Bacteroidota bacterium]
MTSTEIRNSFIKFFEERGHRIVPSAPVIPYDDPTLLFTNAGMNQFKDVFLGIGKRDYTRAVNSQKCIRVSGKHNDLEEVGRDTYHHTLFEMLGNWSFGDPARPAGGYYKKEAIEWAWELLTKVWGLDKKRLYATVFETDDEAEQLWRKVTDIDPIHVLRFGKKDNFWEMGETGPCGPCSEIHIDLTDDLSGIKLVNADDPRVMEIWNLVFIQYNRDENGTLTPLPAKHVDTGMGFERICAVLQGKKSNYETDVFMPIITRISELVDKLYQSKLEDPLDISMRVIADHVRMLSFSIADGGIPSNEGRGYVMRRILRRAARFGRNLGMHEPFIYKVVEAVVHSMGNQYPEIKEKQTHIERVIKGEEESFNVTLDRGLEIFESVVARLEKSKTFPGEDAFKLYDTFGFPIDLTQLIAEDRGLHVDIATFTELMNEQRERARTATKGKFVFNADVENLDALTEEDIISSAYKPSVFVGYETTETIAEVVRIRKIKDKILVALDRTTFYVESGGQVDDAGYIEYNNGRINIQDVIKHENDIYHVLDIVEAKEIKISSVVKTVVNKNWRLKTMKNHTATHLLHEALRQVLGTHVQQQGSLVAPDHLRFDFNHFEKLNQEQLSSIEKIVNDKITAAVDVQAEVMSLDKARKVPGVKMFFGEKYGDIVRVIKMADNFSAELCGGTHVKNTRDIGSFKIISESSIASGIRRIEAVTGKGVKQYIDEQLQMIGELDKHLSELLKEKESLEKELSQYKKVEPSKQPSLGIVPTSTETPTRKTVNEVELLLQQREQATEQVNKEILDLKKELSKYRVKEAASGIDALVTNAISFDGFKIVSAKLEVSTMEELKSIGDTLRLKLSSGVGVLGAIIDDKVALVCVVTDDLIKEKKIQAGKIVSEVAKIAGGSGGGRPHMATAGGKDIDKLDEALSKVPEIVKAMI